MGAAKFVGGPQIVELGVTLGQTASICGKLKIRTLREREIGTLSERATYTWAGHTDEELLVLLKISL